jgi:dipeptidyl aminopeptidase/acylaminoacyl peptidase
MTQTFRKLGVAGLGAALAAGTLGAAEAQRPMQLQDLFDLSSVGSIAVQPGGDQVAYVRYEVRDVVEGEADGTPVSSLHVASGPNTSRLFIEDRSIGGLDWRDGERLTFTSSPEDGPTALFEIPANGGEARELYAHDTAIRAYAFAPDGDTVFFIAPDEGGEHEETLHDRGFRANIYEEDMTYSRVWRVDLSEDEAEAVVFELEGHASDLVVSPDGEHLAVALSATPLVDDLYMETRWSIVDAASGEVGATFETPGKLGQGAFSPDGDYFAFMAGVDRADSVAQTVHVGNVSSGTFEILARDAEQHGVDLAWQNDNSLAVLVHTGLQSALVEYRRDGNETRRTVFSDFVARSMDRDAQSGRLALVADAPTHPGELFVSRRRDFERWTTSNDWLGEIAFGDQRGYSFETRDGLRVEGVLVTPSGEAPDGGWPLIMTVHGGPEAHDSNGWMTGYSRPGHIGAGKGFAVFYPNYRGSTGRGEAFIELDHQDGPGEEFNDLVDAIGALSEDGIVNADKAGITGGSYGGFASAWGATIASEHFAASVPFVALTDLIGFFGTTEIPVEMVDVHFMEYPWQAWESYLDHSPIHHAQGSTTPTLILHGEADTRVDPSQSYELYRYLKMTGEAPVRLVTYPGEGHGNRNAAAQYDYGLRMMRWFEHYLQGEGGEPPAHELPYGELLGLDD